MRGNNVMRGYFNDPDGHGEGVRGRLVPLRRRRRDASRRLHRAARPLEGHHHLGRREHLDHRGREGDRASPRGAGVRGGRDARREVGRGAEGVRHAAPGRPRRRRPTSSRSRRSSSPPSSAPRPSSSATCPRPPPARSRSSSCARRSGPGRARSSWAWSSRASRLGRVTRLALLVLLSTLTTGCVVVGVGVYPEASGPGIESTGNCSTAVTTPDLQVGIELKGYAPALILFGPLVPVIPAPGFAVPQRSAGGPGLSEGRDGFHPARLAPASVRLEGVRAHHGPLE